LRLRRAVFHATVRSAYDPLSVSEEGTLQTTLLGLAIAFILALIAALVGPYFVDWNQFRPQFEAEASRVIGAPVRVAGQLDALLLPTPTLRLRGVAIGGDKDASRLRADKLDVEFSLGSLMRGELRVAELALDGAALDLGLDRQGRIDVPSFGGRFNLGSLAIDRLHVKGRLALHDAASGGTLQLDDLQFSGDVRAPRRHAARRGHGDARRRADAVPGLGRTDRRRPRHAGCACRSIPENVRSRPISTACWRSTRRRPPSRAR